MANLDPEAEETRSVLTRVVNRYPALTFRALAALLGLLLAGGGYWLKAAYGEFKATTAEMRDIRNEQERIKERAIERDRRIEEVQADVRETRADVRETRSDVKEILKRLPGLSLSSSTVPPAAPPRFVTGSTPKVQVQSP